MPLHRNMVAEAIIVADPPQHHLAVLFLLQEVPATPPSLIHGAEILQGAIFSTTFDIYPLRSLILLNEEVTFSQNYK